MKLQTSPNQLLVIIIVAMASTAIACIFFCPFTVRATILKEAPLPASFEQFTDPLFNIDFATFRMYNLSLQWYDQYDHVTYTLFVSNVTALANHGEESIHGNDQAILLFVHVHNFTLASDPLRYKAHLDHLDVTLEFRVDDGDITYQAYVTRTTTLWHELTGW